MGAAPNFSTHRVLLPQTIPPFGCTCRRDEDFHLKIWRQDPAQQHPWPGPRTVAPTTSWAPHMGALVGNGAPGLSLCPPAPSSPLPWGMLTPLMTLTLLMTPPPTSQQPQALIIFNQALPKEGAAWRLGRGGGPTGRRHLPDKANPA